MRKFCPLTIDNPKPRRFFTQLRFVLLLLVVLAVSPILGDGTKIVVARWQSLSGPVVGVETPALDFTNHVLRLGRQSAIQGVSSLYKRFPWQRDWVVGALVVCAGMCCLLLNRR